MPSFTHTYTVEQRGDHWVLYKDRVTTGPPAERRHGYKLCEIRDLDPKEPGLPYEIAAALDAHQYT